VKPRGPASVSVGVSGSVSGSGQRLAASVGGLGERERHAARGSRAEHRSRPRSRLPRSALSATRQPNTLTLTPTLAAPRVPALQVARNFPTRSAYMSVDFPRSP
jgi:hypothetical protein